MLKCQKQKNEKKKKFTIQKHWNKKLHNKIFFIFIWQVKKTQK